MNQQTHPERSKEISCRVTRTLLMYVRENNNGTLGNLLDGLPLDEGFLADTNNWVSHAFLQVLYQRMIDQLGDENAVYNMTLSSGRLQSLGILDRIVRLLGSPRLIYAQAPKYNKFLKLNGTVHIHEIGDSWLVLEDRYHDSAQKTRFDCDYTRGVLAGIPTMFGLPLAEVEEIKCQVAHEKYGHRIWPDSPPQGCGGCVYRVQWMPRKKTFLRRLFLGWNYRRQAITDLVQANQLIQNKYDEVRRLADDLERANRDLLESKQILESQKVALIDSERKYRVLAENVSDIIWNLDLKTLKFVYISPSVEKSRGFTAEEARAMTLEESLSPSSLEAVSKILQTELTNDGNPGVDPQRSRRIEIEQSLKGGGYSWAEATVSFIRDRSGSPIAVLGVTRDISERKRAEKKIAESEEKYKEIVRHAPAGIFEFDMERFKLISVNEVMSAYTGYTKDELMEMDLFSLLDAESREKAKKLFEKVLSGGASPPPAEYTIHGKNGREMYVIMNTRFFLRDGVPEKAMTVVHDLTDIRKAEEATKVLEVKLQNAKKLESLGTLAGGVAHDLNNILSGIVSYPDLLLLDIGEDSPLREPLLTIRNSGQRAAEIVQDLLTLARRGVASMKVINLNLIVRDFIGSPECHRLVGARRDLRVQPNLSESMLNLVGSETHISKALMNLVANAADAMPTGGVIEISTRDCYIDKPFTGFEVIPEGEYAVMEVSDTGIGMPPSDLEKIFEPFYTKKNLGRSGTGLGMSVVWGTVKDHGGFIDIVTEEGSGTTFLLYFPASREERHISSTVCIEEYLGKGESILIVDDAPEQRELAKRMLQRLGYDVSTAASGEDAVVWVQKKPFDLLVLDMIMPDGIDGLETYRQILEIVPDQKAVIASGYAETDRVREAQQIGAGAYIKKPFTLERIGLAVRAELDRKGPGKK